MSNNDFVFNSTDSLLFLQSGEEWFDAVIRSISRATAHFTPRPQRAVPLGSRRSNPQI